MLTARRNDGLTDRSSTLIPPALVPMPIQKDVTQIIEFLKDNKTKEWKTKIEKIERLKLIMMQLANTYENDEEQRNAAIGAVMGKIQASMIVQINDLRIPIAKAACSFITWMSFEFTEVFGQVNQSKQTTNPTELSQTMSIGSTYGGNGIRYFREDALFKLVGTGNKTLGELGHQTIVDILTNNNCLVKIFPYLCSQQKTKNPTVRLRMAQYLFIVMRNYDVYNLNQNSEFIDIFLAGSLQD